MKTEAQKQISKIRKEIAIEVKNGISLTEARKKANIKYGKDWREKGLVKNY